MKKSVDIWSGFGYNNTIDSNQPGKSKMKRIDLENWLVSAGWTRDRWGHYKANRIFNSEDREFRIKLQVTSCRYEVKTNGGDWLKFANDYYKNCEIVDNALKISRRTII